MITVLGGGGRLMETSVVWGCFERMCSAMRSSEPVNPADTVRNERLIKRMRLSYCQKSVAVSQMAKGGAMKGF